jgi:hypothetical protein
MKLFKCPRCEARIFFENLRCLGCGCPLGYQPQQQRFDDLDSPETAQHWQVCSNRDQLGCNWVVAMVLPVVEGSSASLCDCCRFTRTIPSLDDVVGHSAWRNLENAKRYLFYSLLALQLPLPDRAQQPQTGLTFEFLAELSQQERVLTGHADGVITINIAEADTLVREQRRLALHEPYRTLLGHLRHEIGHFYWDQLVVNSGHLQPFRELFGDDRSDYAAALQQHYQQNDDGAWRGAFISRYASAHPWEDWAECWAHYLHITDALDTAHAWQINGAGPATSLLPIDLNSTEQSFKEQLSTQWLPLAQYLNAACRSLGEVDAYPFVITPNVADKLAFIHQVIATAKSATR